MKTQKKDTFLASLDNKLRTTLCASKFQNHDENMHYVPLIGGFGVASHVDQPSKIGRSSESLDGLVV